MSALSIQPTYPIFTDIDGQPLEDGFVWIGQANLDPQVNPINVYWDADLTIPAGQPIRTLAGYPANSGTPARLYVNSDYSIRVMNKNGGLVYSAPEATERFSDVVTSGIGAENVTTTIGYTGGVQRTQQQVNDDRVSVFDFMTSAQIAAVKAYTSTENLSAPVQAAVNTGKRVYLPAGKYKFNLTINNKTVLEGDGSTATRVSPYDDTVAVMTYTFAATTTPLYRYWTYHSEVRDIGFYSNAAKTGVGFTFGTTIPSNYTTNMEYANNVKFYGCYFEGFDKGVQFPFGNIGTEFYSCGFGSNKYGVYTMDNKFGGTMHAGNKYFYGGEMHSNDVALYINNAVTDGFGAISLYGTIIEGNKIGIYAYIAPRVLVPLNLDSVWFEANGYSQGGSSTIDEWTGSTRSDQTLTNYSIIIDGSASGTPKFNIRSGFVPDYYLMAPNTQFVATDCRVEGAAGYGGGPGVIDYPESSYAQFENPYSEGGWWSGGAGRPLPFVTGMANMTSDILNPGARAVGRCFQTNARGSKVTGYGPSLKYAQTFTTAQNLGNGSFNLAGSTASDGRIYGTCNEFTRAAFGSGQYVALTDAGNYVTTSAGWYVFTVDFKVVSGSGVRIFVWDRSTAQLAQQIRAPSVGKWYTAAAIGHSDGSQTLYLDFSGNDGDVTWRVSAYQIHRFDTQQEAFMFLQSNVFAES
jgi:hypothetical protein